jgi:hypothetical protein
MGILLKLLNHPGLTSSHRHPFVFAAATYCSFVEYLCYKKAKEGQKCTSVASKEKHSHNNIQDYHSVQPIPSHLRHLPRQGASPA